METSCLRLFTLAAHLFLLLLDLLAPVFSLSGHTIPALLGDDVPLTCLAPSDMSFDALEVIKPGLGDRYVSFLSDGRLDVENQHPSYVDRVELVKNNDNNNVTLILKNVTLSDSGVYECHFITSGRKPVSDGNGSFGTKSSYNITVNVRDQTDGGVKETNNLNNNGGGNTTGRDVTGTDQEFKQRLLKAVLFIGGSAVAVSVIIKIW